MEKRRGWRDLSGTTIALTSLAVLGVATVVSAPFWIWYRRKRKRADAFARTIPAEAHDSGSQVPATTGRPHPTRPAGE